MSSCEYTDHKIIYYATDNHQEVKQFDIFEENDPGTQTTWLQACNKVIKGRLKNRNVSETQMNLACDRGFQTPTTAQTMKLLKFLVHVRIFEKFPETPHDTLCEDISEESVVMNVIPRSMRVRILFSRSRKRPAICYCQLHPNSTEAAIGDNTLIFCTGDECLIIAVHVICQKFGDFGQEVEHFRCSYCVNGLPAVWGFTTNRIKSQNIHLAARMSKSPQLRSVCHYLMPDGTKLLSILDNIKAFKYFESVEVLVAIRNYLIVMSQLPETSNSPSIGDINTALKSLVTDWMHLYTLVTSPIGLSQEFFRF